MELSLVQTLQGGLQQQVLDEILDCNQFTARFGLTLTPAQGALLAQARGRALQSSGRLEFGSGTVTKLIKAFCDSPYISGRNYTDMIEALIDLFYEYKNESLDRLSDDELIAVMKALFNGSCQGDLELLAGRDLEAVAKEMRGGMAANNLFKDDTWDESDESPYDEDDEEYEDWKGGAYDWY